MTMLSVTPSLLTISASDTRKVKAAAFALVANRDYNLNIIKGGPAGFDGGVATPKTWAEMDDLDGLIKELLYNALSVNRKPNTDLEKATATANRLIERRDFFMTLLREADPNTLGELATTWKELEWANEEIEDQLFTALGLPAPK